MFKLNSKTYVFRPLLISELQAINSLSKMLNACFIEDWILKQTYVYATDPVEYILNNESFGIVRNLAIKIIEKSNIETEDLFLDLLTNARENIDTVQTSLELFIQKAFPGTENKVIRNLTNFKQIEYIAKAESLLGNKLNIGKNNKRNDLKKYRFAEGANVIGPDDITSPEVADKPEW